MKYPPKQIGLKHIDWSGLVLSTEMPNLSKLIVLYLSRFMNKEQDVAWPSQARMEAEMSISKNALNNHLNLLESEGWIKRERGDSKTNTRYHISFPVKIEKALAIVNKGSTQEVLGSTSEELRSTSEALDVVPEKHTNRQLNRQTNRGGKKFIPPTLQEVQEYVKKRQSSVDPVKFMEYFTEGKWFDSNGKKVKNWKQKIISWEGRGNKNNSQNRCGIDSIGLII